MGLDFIRRAAPTFKKSWSGGASTLAQASLFTRYPECRSRSVVATIHDNSGIEAGAIYAVHVDGDALCLVRETAKVATSQTPPADLFSAIKQSGGCALGRVAQINPLSGTADVEIE